MVGKCPNMLSYANYVLAMGLCFVDAKGTETADTADRVHEAIKVGLRTIEIAQGTAL